jgi:UDP-N-acetylglucosamine 2-epimerase (non-hydrolysing)
MPTTAPDPGRAPLPDAPILHVVGTRPNFMKAAPVWRGLARVGAAQQLVHTGQHYDAALSQAFFDVLELPAPAHRFDVGSGTHARQTAEVMMGMDAVLSSAPAAAVVVYGDVNSSVGAALVACKLGVPVVHVEAGLRSRDRSMPEEHNRVVIDHVGDLLLTPSRDGDANLIAEGVPPERIAFAGNTMVDSLLEHLPAAIARATADELGLPARGYLLVTLHRPALTDDRSRLAEAVGALVDLAEELPVIFPLHPRTRARLADAGLLESLSSACVVTEPIDYVDSLSLQRTAAAVLTDSGGVQEETTVLGTPCFTLRDNTERPITISDGTNTLLGLRPERIREIPELLRAAPRDASSPEGWDGDAGRRCAEAIMRLTSEASRLAPTI